MHFALAILAALKGDEEAKKVADGLLIDLY